MHNNNRIELEMTSMKSLARVVFVALVSAVLVNCIGRNPQPVEHNACRVRYADVLAQTKLIYKDQGSRIVAYNKGLEGQPCMTSCRVQFRGNNKDLDDIFTPNHVMCATGNFPRYCIDGRCVLPSDQKETK